MKSQSAIVAVWIALLASDAAAHRLVLELPFDNCVGHVILTPSLPSHGHIRAIPDGGGGILAAEFAITGVPANSGLRRRR